MKLSNTEQVKELKDRREILQRRLKNAHKPLVTSGVFVSLRAPRVRNEDDDIFHAYRFEDPYEDVLLASLPPRDPRIETISAIIIGLIKEEIDRIEAQLAAFEVTLS